jgi:hypothetical protein
MKYFICRQIDLFSNNPRCATGYDGSLVDAGLRGERRS